MSGPCRGSHRAEKWTIFFRFVDDERTVVALDVVIVTYNSAEYLPRVLGSLPDWVDVIVIDNASSDDSAELARSAGVTVVANDVNAGFAAACNQGASLGDADFVLFLNPDATIDGDNLENCFVGWKRILGSASPRRSFGIRTGHNRGSAGRFRVRAALGERPSASIGSARARVVTKGS